MLFKLYDCCNGNAILIQFLARKRTNRRLLLFYSFYFRFYSKTVWTSPCFLFVGCLYLFSTLLGLSEVTNNENSNKLMYVELDIEIR